MVGGYALRYALENPAVGRATSIGRKKLGISHPKLTEVLHPDFADCSALADTLSGQDAVAFCLGAYTGAVSDAELRTITVDYAIEFARVLRLSSPDAAFSFLSGNGADSTRQSAVEQLSEETSDTEACPQGGSQTSPGCDEHTPEPPLAVPEVNVPQPARLTHAEILDSYRNGRNEAVAIDFDPRYA
jgi:hypothetical protein